MTTRVVNIRDEDFDVYIGRAGRSPDTTAAVFSRGYFGNPYPAGKLCTRCGQMHKTGAETLPCFRAYFTERVLHDREFANAVAKLRGKTLGCFCKPKPCHGDIIVEWLASGGER